MERSMTVENMAISGKLKVQSMEYKHFTVAFVLCAQLCLTLCDPMDYIQPTRLLRPWNFSGKNTGQGCHFLLPGIFPTQGSKSCLLCLLHWQADSLPLTSTIWGEGNGTPLQCSCLENPRDGGTWWAAVYGVTQSRTRLKRLSSSSSSSTIWEVQPWPLILCIIYLHLTFLASFK